MKNGNKERDAGDEKYHVIFREILAKYAKKTSIRNFTYQHWVNPEHTDLLVECKGCNIRNNTTDIDSADNTPCIK